MFLQSIHCLLEIVYVCDGGIKLSFGVAHPIPSCIFICWRQAEDDALYPVLNWSDDRNGATIVSAFVICVLSPCLFYACWALSLKSSPRSCSGGINAIHHDDEAISTTAVTTRHGCCSGNFDGSRRPLYPLIDSSAVTELSDSRHYKVMEDKVMV